MKLYTEKQVVYAIRIAFDIEPPIKVRDILRELTPIELPSDEEIENGYEPKTMYDLGYLDGAKWMRDKIQGGKQ